MYYTEDHEWIAVEGDIATIGVTDHAQEALGDIVFIELPEVGATFEKGQDAAVVESVKAASDVYAPVSGEIVEVNQKILDDNSLVNSDAEGAGWFMKIRMTDKGELDGLLDAAAYKALTAD